MKNFILNLCRTLLGILGFSFVSACDGEGASPIPMYGVPAPEYGSPYAEYFVKGKVTDEAGNPIKGIAVTVPDEYADTVFTSADGSYELNGGFSYAEKTIDVRFTDVDDEENGGWFARQEKAVALEKQEDGKGWYLGLFGALGVDVKMHPVETVAEYGVPYATFEIKGKVVDSEGNPLEGIEVYGEDIYEHMRQKAVTAEDGSFLLVQPDWFPAGEADICFEDVDGEENGGDFGKKTETVKLTQTEDGEGHWNDGVYSSEDLTITM